MRHFFTEFRVGLFVLVGVAIIVAGWFWTTDGIKRGQPARTLHLAVPNADGLWQGSPVKIAGVQVGSVDEPVVNGDHAEMVLRILPTYELPTDSYAEVRSTGLLGDRFIVLFPGDDETLLGDGDWIRLLDQPADLGEIQRDARLITSDLLVVTGALRAVAESDETRVALERTLASIEQLTAQLAAVTSRNVDDVDRIVAAIERLTVHLDEIATATGEDVDEEMAKVHAATDTIQAALDDLHSITGKIDDGEGTLGALVNDDTTIASVNDTLGVVNTAVRGVSRVRFEPYYQGRYYFGTDPDDPTFHEGNPLAGGLSNTFGLRVMPTDDLAFFAELVWTPQGRVTYEEAWAPEQGDPQREYVSRPGPRLSAMFEKRWSFFSVRLGIKESAPGVGATAWFARDRLRLAVDVFDGKLGSYPAVESQGWPNTRVGLAFEPWRGVTFEAGSEQILLGAKYGYFTGYVGVGLSFPGKKATAPAP